MKNNIVISKETINSYKNNIDLLKGLKLRIISGSCSVYDKVLYQSLLNVNEEEKKLKMTFGA